MTIEDGELTKMTADEYRDKYLRFVRIRNPGAKIGPGEYDYIKAQNLANLMLSISNDAKIIAGRISLQDRTGDQLDEIGKPASDGGIDCPRPEATGSSGSVTVQTVSSGTKIFAGDELKPESGIAYYCTVTAVYLDGSQVPVMCRETGPSTNVDPGTVMTWVNPRPGCFASATVYEQTDGTGLTGGSERMGDDDYRTLLASKMSNPASSANPAALRKMIEDSRSHGVHVERAFTYGAALGPGITAFTFTLPGSSTNSSRTPNETQINTVAGYVEKQQLSTDGLVKVPTIYDNAEMTFRVRWSSNGWANSTPWPPFPASENYRFYVLSNISATSFTLGNDVFSGPAPSPGDVIAFFDKSTGKVIKKTIATVVNSSGYNVTCETLASASDLVYVPVIGQLVMPWSDSLQSIADKTIDYINKMGPGEIVSTLPDDGMRIARDPANERGNWPSQMDSGLESSIAEIKNVKRVNHDLGSDYVTPTGGLTAVYLAKLNDFAVYAL